MSLIDRLIEPTKKYISFTDFLFHLSSSNNQPLYDVVTYLLHHDLNSIRFYNIDKDYKIIKFEPFEFNSITDFLKEVQDALAISACDWVFSSSESLDELIESDRKLLTDAIFKAMHSFFKKSELLSFKPLDGLIHFDPEDIDDESDSSVSVEQLLEDALERVDSLEESLANSSFLIGTLTLSRNEYRTSEQLTKALTVANDKIKQQEQDIKKLNEHLNDQADKPTEDKFLPYNSQMGMAKMLYAILTEHNYDLSATKGKANSLIEKASQLHGTPVARNFIAKWIELANQAKSDSTK